MVSGTLFEMLPVGPFPLLVTRPSTVMVNWLPLRSQRTVCQSPSFSRVDPEFTAFCCRVPFGLYPRKRHVIRPFGICHLKYPPRLFD